LSPCVDSDTVILVACIGWGVLQLASGDPRHLVLGRLYHIKILYSFLAVPWLMLKLPMAFMLVFHLKPTGYTADGKTVKMATAKQRAEARERRLSRAGAGAVDKASQPPAQAV
jgi:hypothetical protein